MEEKFTLDRDTDHLPLPALKVLVVDDSVALRQFMLSALHSTGFSVTASEDGRDALEKARAETFNLVITDHNMPEMNGIQLIRHLRTLPQYQTTPILVLTMESNAELKQNARESGATGWIVKPIHPNTIVALVKQLLIGALITKGIA